MIFTPFGTISVPTSLLQLGLGIFVYFWLFMMLIIPSAVAGFIIAALTLPLLYVTGLGFVPLHRSPAYEEQFQISAIYHVATGTLAFGTAMFGSLLSSEFLSEGVQLPGVGLINGGLLITLIVLSVGLIGTIFASKPNGHHITSVRPVLMLIGVWYGYPSLLLLVFLGVLVLTGEGTYHPPSWL